MENIVNAGAGGFIPQQYPDILHTEVPTTLIGIDPGISGSICFFQDGKIIDVVEMPTMIEGKKNKKQVNGAQIFHEISLRIKNLKKKYFYMYKRIYLYPIYS